MQGSGGGGRGPSVRGPQVLELMITTREKNLHFYEKSFKKGEIFMHFDKNSNLIFASIHKCRL